MRSKPPNPNTGIGKELGGRSDCQLNRQQPHVTRVYEFSYFRSVSDTTWSALDGTDSGFYLLGPTGVVRGGGTGLFQWSGSHQLATGTTTQQAAASVRTGATRSKATHFDGRPGLPSGPPHHGGNRLWSDHWTPPAQDPPVPSSW